MKLTILFTAAVCLLFAVEMNAASAQQTQAKNASSRATAGPQPIESTKKIGFRLANWKTIHSHGTQQQTDETIETLQKIGCEVTQSQHGNHTDIKYHCPEWKSLSVETNQQLDQWYSWLNNKGMETLIINPPRGANVSTVRYRLPGVQTAHFHDGSKATSLTNMCKMLGCDVSSSGDDGHIDITIRCENWQTIGLANCQQAHAWQNWLKQKGFETQHSH